MEPDPPSRESEQQGLSEALTAKICATVESLVRGSDEAARDFEELCSKAEQLFHRKVAFAATRNDTRDLLTEVLFSRLRRSFQTFSSQPQARDEEKAAEWVMAALFSGMTLSDLGTAIDKAMHHGAAPREYSFAGLADFISLEEVLQLLGGGNHRGCLSLEKHDNRLDIYMNCGRITYLNPHHLIRRILPMQGMNYRELSIEDLEEAEERHAKEGVPIFVHLEEKGFFKGKEVRDSVRTLGSETLYEFLREQDTVAFFYRRLDKLPDYTQSVDLKMFVTPLLLEGSRRQDDWTKMTSVFPDPDAPVQPGEDMFQRISSLNLAVHEIKMLAHINGENSPRNLCTAIGLPITEIYQILIRFASEGVVVPPPEGIAELDGFSMSVEESMEVAFEALDANDDGKSVTLALDNILGDL